MSVPDKGVGGVSSGPVSVWVSGLSVFTIPALLGAFLRHGRFALRYTSASHGGAAVARIIGMLRLLRGAPQRVVYTGHGARVDDPDSSALDIRVRIPNEFTGQFFSRYQKLLEGFTYPDPRVQNERIRTALRKSVAMATHQLMEYVEFARYWHQTQAVPARRLVIMSPAAFLANTIDSGWAGADVEFRSPWSWQFSLSLKVARDIQHWVAGSIRRRREPTSAPPSIGIAANWGLDRAERLDDLFWWWGSGIPSERVVLYYDRPDLEVSVGLLKRIEELGIRCAVLDHRAPGAPAQLLWRAAPGPAVAAGRLIRNLKMYRWGIHRGIVGRWLACRVLDMLQSSQKFEDFMVEFNVRGLFHWEESGLDHVSIACDAAGRARIGHHWSYYVWPQAVNARMHQVYFTWGLQYARMLEENHSCVDHLLLSGCTVNGAYPGEAGEQVHEHRNFVTSHGATRVLALFDTSLPSNVFYEFFLGRVIQDPRWGLLIKPKIGGMRWMHRYSEEFRVLFEEALATGRVVVLDSRLSPVEAAAAADFSVAVDINSAAMVAALAGHRAIHLDYIRLHDSFMSGWADLYRAGRDRVVFDDPEKLWESLNRFFDQPGSDPGLGIMDEALLKNIDPFRDGLAGERIGEYLRWYLEALDDGRDRDAALAQANLRYANKWGKATVVKGLEATPALASDTKPGGPVSDQEPVRANRGH